MTHPSTLLILSLAERGCKSVLLMGRIIELCETIRAGLLFAARLLLPFPTKRQDGKAKLRVISSSLLTSLFSAAVLERFAPPHPLSLSSSGWFVFNVLLFPTHHKDSPAAVGPRPKRQQSPRDCWHPLKETTWETLGSGAQALLKCVYPWRDDN